MKRLWLQSFMMIVILCVMPAGAGSLGQTPEKDRAKETLAKARAAIGGEAKLKQINALLATGKFRRVVNNKETPGEIKLEFLLPDNYRSTLIINPVGDVEVTIATSLSGGEAWRDTKTMSSSGVQAMALGSGGGQKPDPKEVKNEFVRNLLGLVLLAPPSIALEYTYTGETEVPGGRADVLDVNGPEGSIVRMLFDQKTHLPMMMIYEGISPQTAQTQLKGTSKENVEKALKTVKHDGIQVRLSDYRSVEGLMLPHRIARAANGTVFEEWELSKIKLNPKDIDARSFTRKSS